MSDKLNIDVSEILDARGLYCPEPVFRTKIALEKLQLGNVLKILADDPAADDDISRWVDRNGHILLQKNQKNNYFEFLVQKGK
ncbi:MAG: sulfurtransferase TusA family protein [Thaumarchaeota archaeon]|nr:sulfurtransferase TusA family protein [Nitrososphaerota archaeon]MCY3975695.1 sulfurtransferase TusA family protein [Nitrososphaerota archaeon]